MEATATIVIPIAMTMPVSTSIPSRKDRNKWVVTDFMIIILIELLRRLDLMYRH